MTTHLLENAAFLAAAVVASFSGAFFATGATATNARERADFKRRGLAAAVVALTFWGLGRGIGAVGDSIERNGSQAVVFKGVLHNEEQ